MLRKISFIALVICVLSALAFVVSILMSGPIGEPSFISDVFGAVSLFAIAALLVCCLIDIGRDVFGGER